MMFFAVDDAIFKKNDIGKSIRIHAAYVDDTLYAGDESYSQMCTNIG